MKDTSLRILGKQILYISEESLNLFEDIMEEGGELSKRVEFDEFVDNSFAEKAVS